MAETAVTGPAHGPSGSAELAGRIVSFLVVGLSTAFVVAELHPGLLFANSTDVGGDNAAHVVAADFFLHHLLPHLQLSGWDPEWFGGFPLYVFYFPLPALITAALTTVVPFAVGFKLVTVLGTVLLPISGYLFGRLCGLARPVPALMAVATLAFAFNTSYTIDGGNLPSTLAGEYSFGLALDVALVFLGAVVYTLRTGRLRWLAPVLFAVTILCHVVPALFAAAVAGIVVAVWPRRSRALVIVAEIGIVGALISAFWLLRFTVDLPFSSSMGYTRIPGLAANLFPTSAELAVQVLAIVGALYGLHHGQRVVMALTLSAIGSVLAFAFLPSGLVYNGRWLPFWFLSTALLAAYGVSELASDLLGLVGLRFLHDTLGPAGAFTLTVVVIAAYLGTLPSFATPAGAVSYVPAWISWNYSGYQRKPGWPNFESLVTMLDRATSRYGCGRLDYEYSPNFNNAYGSTLVPMSLPMWTGGCVASAEGLYYESSTSTPFHFLDQSELSLQPSNPVVGIPYQPLNVADGVRHLALTGVRYFLANSLTVERQAAQDPQLTQIASIAADPAAVEPSPGLSDPHPDYVLYLIASARLVRPLRYLPAVETGLSRTGWLHTAISWYQHERDWPVVLTTGGPAAWPRVAHGALVPPARARPAAPIAVTDVHATNSSLTFQVSRPGTPVLVNVPYFPNWSASGAAGPYLASPNMMVVVPTSREVALRYGPTAADWAGRALSLVGLIALVALRRRWEADPDAPGEPLAWVLRAEALARRRRDEERLRARGLWPERDLVDDTRDRLPPRSLPADRPDD